MKRIHLVPIEPLAERYSAQWYDWWRRELVLLGHEVNVIDGQRLNRQHDIKKGEFLDAYDTNYYKASQAMALAKEFHYENVHHDDVILFLDAWNPAVLQAAYMRDISGIKCKLAGLWHAGTYDPHDFLSRTPISWWGSSFEDSVSSALDHNFFATKFSMQLFKDDHIDDNCHITGFPLYAIDWQQHSQPWVQRPMRVVFPHRLAQEKQPEQFDKLREVFEAYYPDFAPHVEWVKSKDVCKTKHEYYRLLGSSRVAFSSALQETWGIAMLEAASLGCHIVAPNRLSYSEIYEPWERYNSWHEAAVAVYNGLRAHTSRNYDGSRWTNAIKKISCVLEGQVWE